MLETIASIIRWIIFAAIALSALATLHSLAPRFKAILDHYLLATLTRRVIGHLITQLHNGEDFKPYTLEHALQTFSHQLTDLLPMNGYNVRDFNPQTLAMAILAESRMLHELISLLEARRQADECPDSTSTLPTSHT